MFSRGPLQPLPFSDFTFSFLSFQAFFLPRVSKVSYFSSKITNRLLCLPWPVPFLQPPPPRLPALLSVALILPVSPPISALSPRSRGCSRGPAHSLPRGGWRHLRGAAPPRPVASRPGPALARSRAPHPAFMNIHVSPPRDVAAVPARLRLPRRCWQ